MIRLEDLVPHGQIIQPVSLGVYHVLVEHLFIESQGYFSVLIHGLDRVRHFQAVIDTIQKTYHGQNLDAIFVSQLFYGTFYNLIRIGKEFLIDSFLDEEILGPEFLQLFFISLLIVGNLTPFL